MVGYFFFFCCALVVLASLNPHTHTCWRVKVSRLGEEVSVF